MKNIYLFIFLLSLSVHAQQKTYRNASNILDTINLADVSTSGKNSLEKFRSIFNKNDSRLIKKNNSIYFNFLEEKISGKIMTNGRLRIKNIPKNLDKKHLLLLKNALQSFYSSWLISYYHFAQKEFYCSEINSKEWAFKLNKKGDKKFSDEFEKEKGGYVSIVIRLDDDYVLSNSSFTLRINDDKFEYQDFFFKREDNGITPLKSTSKLIYDGKETTLLINFNNR
ncbi:hypothetical protein EDM00_05885 [Ornithobacterium rhinotracheale]|uniref:hypothetical protein n=1 Tax=Ornithobacterium rhinotracheale TaxID=28251 RepID=UPI00129CBA15|nr:hypothetical protein [Ornithobacterium rhinotracheale]MRI63519.1 hypothetical protein [Ornithobacterium rhinotracheale]